jgi:hypothetical protein
VGSLNPPCEILFEINHRSTVHGVVFDKNGLSIKRNHLCRRAKHLYDLDRTKLSCPERGNVEALQRVRDTGASFAPSRRPLARRNISALANQATAVQKNGARRNASGDLKF